MQFGLNLPNIGVGDDPSVLGEIARTAEDAGWDGAFFWDAGALGPNHRDYAEAQRVLDVWIGLAVMAQATRRIRLGPLVAPLPRHRPWDLARRVVTLDHLSNGRITLIAGPGADTDGFFERVGEPTSRRERNARLEEGLAIVSGLQTDSPFSFRGEHYTVDDLTFLPPPFQQPRVPIWRWAGVAGAKTVRRALPWDGAHFWFGRPDDIRAARAAASEAGAFDIAIESPHDHGSPELPPDSTADLVKPYADAGATWWIESAWKCAEPPNGSLQVLLDRIGRGPPRL